MQTKAAIQISLHIYIARIEREKGRDFLKYRAHSHFWSDEYARACTRILTGDKQLDSPFALRQNYRSGFLVESGPMTIASSTNNDVTLLLRAWSNGDQNAIEALLPLVYKELHRAAYRYLARENPNHTLQATGLINETYLRLAKMEGFEWQNRGHFYAVCARLMRHILTDYARARPHVGDGEKARFVPLQEAGFPAPDQSVDFIALDEALNRLAEIDERQCQVVQLRYFVGLSVKEAAEVLGVSERTIKQDWTLAKLWLLRELERGGRSGT
jgi:RNA polymerase sigma-70 factor, ECF subfamily